MVVDFKRFEGGQPKKDDYVDTMTREKTNARVKAQRPDGYEQGDYEEREAIDEQLEQRERPYGTFEWAAFPANSPALPDGGRRLDPNEDLVIVAHGDYRATQAVQAGMEPDQMALFVQQFLPVNGQYTGCLDFTGCHTGHRAALRKRPFAAEVLRLVQQAGWPGARARGYAGILQPGEMGEGPFEVHNLWYEGRAWDRLQEFRKTIGQGAAELKRWTDELDRLRWIERPPEAREFT